VQDLCFCPSGWKLAKDTGVSRLDVGEMTDKLGLRVTDCQLGYLTVKRIEAKLRAVKKVQNPIVADRTSPKARTTLLSGSCMFPL
jgi:hypothetical protein